ncbi:hypothetical protein [Serratia symbiotica]|uniref:Uncharacterized protein n=1 Tax=Serratia symbiotica TaxID=138074 RepID=A0A455VF83_9GAMM|nr:hypothetical protein [Serratia symbiotica]BBI91642.1 uncharacterized protein SSYIS1_09160 [Serratia symbiotica]
MFDLISHLTENGIQHAVSDNGNITVGGNLYLSGTRASLRCRTI